MRFVLMVLVLSAIASQAQAGDCGNSTADREPITPVRNILSKIASARGAVCSGVQRVAVVKVERVLRVSRVACSGVAASVASCAGPRATSCAGSVKAPQAISLGVVVPVRSESSAYQQALASAQYRAANRIHGHSPLDTHRTSGVGWASHDSNPTTCLGRGGPNYAVAKGSDGYYSTRFQ